MRRGLLRRLLGPRLQIAQLLLRCNRCGADALYPTRWTEDERLRWRVRLHCDECGHEREATIDRGLARAVHEVLAERAAAGERESMARWVEAFAAALDRDAIRAADFEQP